VAAVIAFTSVATFCLAGVFILVILGYAYYANKTHHESLMQNAILIDQESSPVIQQVKELCEKRIDPGKLNLYVVNSAERNAYTFGMSEPQTIVVYSSLLKLMDPEEMAFVIGHEMGHIRLGHTWLNTILGGMAGIPAPYGAAIILAFSFRWWNRACEYSADRAGLLACQNPQKSISSLLKLVSGARSLSLQDTERLIAIVDREDDNLMGQMSELLLDHPLIIKRIDHIKTFSNSLEYKRLVNL
jgi:Zn-dependent protease with chaperone function